MLSHLSIEEDHWSHPLSHRLHFDPMQAASQWLDPKSDVIVLSSALDPTSLILWLECLHKLYCDIWYRCTVLCQAESHSVKDDADRLDV